MLITKDLHAGYLGADVLCGINLSVPNGQLVALVGTNGAGKSTTMKTLSGMLTARSGQIELDGRLLSSNESHEFARAGLAHIPEGRRIFSSMSVEDNMRMGAYVRYRLRSDRGEIDHDIAQMMERFPHLKRRRKQQAGALSGGEQQMLAIARALMLRPKIILIDEPSLGLAPKLVDDVFSILNEVRSQGMSMLVVEQFAKKALAVASYAYVMERGRIVAEGAPDELQDSKLLQSYLGA